MANIIVKIRPSKRRKDGTIPVVLGLTHNSTVKDIGTRWSVTDKDLDRHGKLKNRKIQDEIGALATDLRRRIDALGASVDSMDATALYDAITKAPEGPWRLDIVQYARDDRDKLVASGHTGTANVRNAMINNLVEFMGRESVDVSEITASLLVRWVDWINNKPISGKRVRGTRGAALYVSQLKAVYNKAKREFNDDDAGIVRIPWNPFGRVKVEDSVPAYRSITTEQIRAIAALPDVPDGWHVRYNLAKDVFVLSFMLLGMNAVDLYNCPAQQDPGRITYERTKTRTRRKDKALISIAIPKEAAGLMKKYRGGVRGHEFVFSKLYGSAKLFNNALNTGLREVGKAVGIEGLQFYAARHTWATIAYNECGVDKGVVGDGLNHVDKKMSVTDRYIRKSWDRIDDAQRKVLDHVFGEVQKQE